MSGIRCCEIMHGVLVDAAEIQLRGALELELALALATLATLPPFLG